MKRTLLFIFLSLFLLDGCSSHRVNEILKDVESYIMERPDSALAVLDTMDRTLLKNEHLRAHHALLHAMALDKNYIDVTDDSLSNVALKYYQNHGDKRNLVRSLYYKGLAYYYNEQYDKSISELSKAEPIAVVCDSLYLGFIQMLKANIYDLNYNDLDELECIKSALRIYAAINAVDYIDVAKLRLAQSYMSNGNYEEAESILEDLLLNKANNETIILKANRDYAFLKGTCPNPDYKTTIVYYEKAIEVGHGKYMSYQDYWVWAYALVKTSNNDAAQKILDKLVLIDTSGTAYYWQYAIAKAQGRDVESLDYFEKFSDINNEEVVQILKQSISIAQRDYYQSQYEISENIIRIRSLILWIVIISTLFILSLMCISIIRYRCKKEEEKVYYIRYAGEVSRQLDEFKNGTYSSLQKKYISMYKTKYETLQILFEKYLQTEDRVDAERLIYKRVVSLIDELRKDIENSTRFDRNLDEELNGMMTKLRTELPTLNKRYYTLFGYLALGFNSTIISHFMGCSENAVRIIKNRLKGIVKNSDAEHKLDFLEVIG
ncbi:MAG: hypothetical protein IKV91_06690 [Bacteroidales bacterium]|nr:hypothetical protein [Bacteroidales bacterium]